MSTETPGTPATTWYSPALLAAVEMILGSQDIPALVEHRDGDSAVMPWARAVLDAAADEVAAIGKRGAELALREIAEYARGEARYFGGSTERGSTFLDVAWKAERRARAAAPAGAEENNVEEASR